jgi:hypothetical protein
MTPTPEESRRDRVLVVNNPKAYHAPENVNKPQIWHSIYW